MIIYLWREKNLKKYPDNHREKHHHLLSWPVLCPDMQQLWKVSTWVHFRAAVRSCRVKVGPSLREKEIRRERAPKASAWAWGAGPAQQDTIGSSCLHPHPLPPPHPHPGKSLSCCFRATSQGGNWYYFLMLGQLAGSRPSSVREREAKRQREWVRVREALEARRRTKCEGPASSQFELSRLASRTPSAEADNRFWPRSPTKL